MPTTDNESPDGRLLVRIVLVIGAIFAAVMGVFFIRSAPARSPETCVAPDGSAWKPAQCLSCHVTPHMNGQGYQIRRVDAKTGIIETVSREAALRSDGTVTDAQGNRYGVSPLEHVVWKQTAGAENPTILAGVIANGRAVKGFGGDGGTAVEARLFRPSSVALDAAGNVYVADTMNNRVRRITPDGAITTVAGNGKTGTFTEGEPATESPIEKPISVAVDRQGNLLIAHGNGREGRILRVDGKTANVETLVGGGSIRERKGDGHPARDAVLKRPVEVTFDPTTGDLYIAESRPVLRHWNIGNCSVCHRLPK